MCKVEKIKRLAFFDSLEVFADQSAERVPPTEIMLAKYGKNEFTKDGTRGDFDFTEKDADAVIAEFSTRGKDIVIDYEHQTLSGNKAPASGWGHRLEKTDSGLKAIVKYWTAEAIDYLKSGAYRYFSPVFQFSRSGKSVSALHSIALTNHPALHGIPALVADDLADDEGSDSSINLNQGNKMDKVLTLLGLVAFSDKTDAEKESAVSSRIGELVKMDGEAKAFLQLHDGKTFEELTGKIKSMVPATEKTRLESELVKRDADAAVTLALTDCKVSEAMKPWALKFATNDLAGFSDWCKGAPKIVPDGKGTEQAAGKTDEVKSFSDAEVKILKAVGLTDEKIKTMKKE